MPKKHTGLTIEQHKELGLKIKLLKQLHFEILNVIANAYGKTSRAGQAARSIVRVETLAREMDNNVCRETDRQEWDENNYRKIYF